jgi:uncharacterized DUF497 family protein
VTLGYMHKYVHRVVLAHTETANEVRMISMRKAIRNEQVLYFQNI